MLKVKDKEVTIAGEPEEVLVEFAMLAKAMARGLGFEMPLMAFVQGLDKAAEENKKEKEEETNDTV